MENRSKRQIYSIENMYCPESKEKDSNHREYMNETTQKMMHNWKFSTN